MWMLTMFSTGVMAVKPVWIIWCCYVAIITVCCIRGAFRIERTSGRQGSARISRIEFIFRRPDGQEIRRSLYPQFEQPKIGRDGALAIEGQHRALGLEIDAGTAITAWQGERMDYDTAVGAMWAW